MDITDKKEKYKEMLSEGMLPSEALTILAGEEQKYKKTSESHKFSKKEPEYEFTPEEKRRLVIEDISKKEMKEIGKQRLQEQKEDWTPEETREFEKIYFSLTPAEKKEYEFYTSASGKAKKEFAQRTKKYEVELEKFKKEQKAAHEKRMIAMDVSASMKKELAKLKPKQKVAKRPLYNPLAAPRRYVPVPTHVPIPVKRTVPQPQIRRSIPEPRQVPHPQIKFDMGFSGGSNPVTGKNPFLDGNHIVNIKKRKKTSVDPFGAGNFW